VTANPPAALPAPSSTAKKPIVCSRSVLALSSAKIPADHDDAVHEVRTGHQRRVQDRWDVPDDDPAGKGGEHEDIKCDKSADRH
jgi:hypothetical protein